jgi:hypothetical protein
MQLLEVSGVVRPLYWPLGVKGLMSELMSERMNAALIPYQVFIEKKQTIILQRAGYRSANTCWNVHILEDFHLSLQCAPYGV